MRPHLLLAARRAANMLGLRQHKVFAIGFNKTGTTSIHALFESLGFPAFHGTEWRALQNRSLLRRHDGFSDGAPGDIGELDRAFPGARFILQVRELDDWVFSRLAHIDREKARGVHVADPGWDTTTDSVAGWVMRRNAYHHAVLSHFSGRPRDLLVVNFVRDPGAATRIARFLGVGGTHHRPEQNIRRPGPPPPPYQAMLDAALSRHGVPRPECRNDILCPSALSAEDRWRFPADTRLLDGAP